MSLEIMKEEPIKRVKRRMWETKVDTELTERVLVVTNTLPTRYALQGVCLGNGKDG